MNSFFHDSHSGHSYSLGTTGFSYMALCNPLYICQGLKMKQNMVFEWVLPIESSIKPYEHLSYVNSWHQPQPTNGQSFPETLQYRSIVEENPLQQHIQTTQKPSTRNDGSSKKPQGVKYFKKNTQSNISNQVLSYLSCSIKSGPVLTRLCQQFGLDCQSTIPQFYSYMKAVKSGRKKYLNKKLLLSLCRPNSLNPLYRQIGKSGLLNSHLDIDVLAKLVRSLVRSFLSQCCILTVLTSKKIDKESMGEHLVRRRQIMNFLNEQLRNM